MMFLFLVGLFTCYAPALAGASVSFFLISPPPPVLILRNDLGVHPLPSLRSLLP